MPLFGFIGAMLSNEKKKTVWKVSEISKLVLQLSTYVILTNRITHEAMQRFSWQQQPSALTAEN